MSFGVVLARTEWGYKFVPDVSVSFAKNAKILANRRVPFHWCDDPVRAANFLHVYSAMANDIYAKLTAVQSNVDPSAGRRYRKQLKGFYKEELTDRFAKSGEDIYKPGVQRRIVFVAGRNLGQEIGFCRDLVQDYEAAKPKPAAQPKRRSRTLIPD